MAGKRGGFRPTAGRKSLAWHEAYGLAKAAGADDLAARDAADRATGREPQKRAAAAEVAAAAIAPTDLGGETDEEPAILDPDAAKKPIPPAENPLALMEAIMNDVRQDVKTRLRAAIAAAQYRHAKRADEGKKKTAEHKAKQAAAPGGKYAPAEGPKLRAVGGSK